MTEEKAEEKAAVSDALTETDDDVEEAVPVPPPENPPAVQNTENDVETKQSSAVKVQSSIWRVSSKQQALVPQV